MTDRAATLAATPTIDRDHPDVIAFAARIVSGAENDVEAGVRLFEAVRDSVLYDPYACVLTEEGLRASTTLATRRAWCVPRPSCSRRAPAGRARTGRARAGPRARRFTRRCAR